MRYDLRKIKRERERRGWSQTTLAAVAGVSCSRISTFERGKAPGSPTLVRRIAFALDIPMAAFCVETAAEIRLRRKP